eukprot:254680-Pelagomonas_calceolata.AAC.1
MRSSPARALQAGETGGAGYCCVLPEPLATKFRLGETQQAEKGDRSSNVKVAVRLSLVDVGKFPLKIQTPSNTSVSSEAHNPPSQLANKEISNSFWNNPKIILKQQINVLKYRTGT